MKALVAFDDVVARNADGPNIKIDATTFMPGRLHVIVGANGSGKSSFLRLMLGFLPILNGHIRWQINNCEWMLDARHRLPDSFYQHIGYLQQGPESLWPQFDVLEHVERAVIHRCARLGLANRNQVRAYAQSVLAELRIDPDKWRRRMDVATVGGAVQGFSGGERQRVAFARAIAARPDILLLDELEASLDAETQDRLIGGFMRGFVRDPGHTAFVVTHDPANWTGDGWGDCARQVWRIIKTDGQIRIESFA